MEKVFLNKKMVIITKESGKTMYLMEKESKSSKMGIFMKGNITKALKMELVDINGTMILNS